MSGCTSMHVRNDRTARRHPYTCRQRHARLIRSFVCLVGVAQEPPRSHPRANGTGIRRRHGSAIRTLQLAASFHSAMPARLLCRVLVCDLRFGKKYAYCVPETPIVIVRNARTTNNPQKPWRVHRFGRVGHPEAPRSASNIVERRRTCTRRGRVRTLSLIGRAR